MLNILAQARFPKPEFTSGYDYPSINLESFYANTDLHKLLFYLALMFFVYLGIYKFRSKKFLLLSSLISVLVIGFYYKACPCPIGLLQSTVEFIFNSGAYYTFIYFLIFAIPILVALFFGRLFCGGACPIGAMQELLFFKELKIPMFLDKTLRLIPYVILCVCVSFASVSGPAIACAYDPFVPIFRATSMWNMSVVALVVVGLCIFISRPYCKYFCPYSVFLKFASYLSSKKVKISPRECISCKLCEAMCPNGAILIPEPASTNTKKFERIKTVILLLPVFALVGAFLGYAFGLVLYNFHPSLSLYNQLIASEDNFYTQAYWQNYTSLDYLENALSVIRWRMSLSSAICMGIVGLLVAFDIILSSKKKHSNDYEVDKGLCYLCGRCYSACPLEIERLKKVK